MAGEPFTISSTGQGKGFSSAYRWKSAAYSGGRIVGFCAPPYYLRQHGRVVPWQPGVSGSRFQYAGFGCALDPGGLIYTLGYENAPWFFLDSHHYFPRAKLGSNCFRLEPGEEVRFTVAAFSYPAESETALNGAVRTVYSLYHESPRKCQSPETAVRRISEAVSADAWLPDSESYAGFVFDKPDSHEVRPLPSLSWTNGLAVAVPMLMAALRLIGMDTLCWPIQLERHRPLFGHSYMYLNLAGGAFGG